MIIGRYGVVAEFRWSRHEHHPSACIYDRCYRQCRRKERGINKKSISHAVNPSTRSRGRVLSKSVLSSRLCFSISHRNINPR